MYSRLPALSTGLACCKCNRGSRLIMITASQRASSASIESTISTGGHRVFRVLRLLIEGRQLSLPAIDQRRALRIVVAANRVRRHDAHASQISLRLRIIECLREGHRLIVVDPENADPNWRRVARVALVSTNATANANSTATRQSKIMGSAWGREG